MDIQFWLGMFAGVAVFGFSCFGVGVYVGIRSEQKEQAIARGALSIGNAQPYRR